MASTKRQQEKKKKTEGLQGSSTFSALLTPTAINKLTNCPEPEPWLGFGPLEPGLVTLLRWPKSPQWEVLTSFEEEPNRSSSKAQKPAKGLF